MAEPLPGEKGHPSYFSPAAAMGFSDANKKYGELSKSKKARRHGKMSGEARAANAKYKHGRKVPHRRDRALALAHAYPVKLADFMMFARRFSELAEREERAVSIRGLETAWREYMGCVRVYRKKGQAFRTTNAQRARAHHLRGRGRCERTIQRTHHRLAPMGYLRRSHVKKQRDRAGRKDCLEITISFVTPPLAAPAALQAVAGALPLAEDFCPQQAGRPPPNDPVRPPFGGSGEPPAEAGGNSSTKNEEQNGPLIAGVRPATQEELDSSAEYEEKEPLSIAERLQRLRDLKNASDVP